MNMGVVRRVFVSAGKATAQFMLVIALVVSISIGGRGYPMVLLISGLVVIYLLLFITALEDYHNKKPVKVIYTNWRGETSERTIIPKSFRYGSSEWHPESQWLVRAYDVDKKVHREFALLGFGAMASTKDMTDVLRKMKRTDSAWEQRAAVQKSTCPHGMSSWRFCSICNPY